MNKPSDSNVEKIRAEKGLGIWGNRTCIQCGACCHEYFKYLFKIGASNTEQCAHFSIKDGMAHCMIHEQQREAICTNYFCGDTDFIFRFGEKGDAKLREIAETLDTVPFSFKIPSLVL
ncbi:MAG: hypothetical protein AAB795_00725 [Patescibacteria group bacterium]